MTKSKRAHRKISGFQRTLDECIEKYKSQRTLNEYMDKANEEKRKYLEQLRKEVRQLIGVET